MSDSDPFVIAKEALQMIGQFNTPPTPEVFEVWYRFVEGTDDASTGDLKFAVEELKSVAPELLNTIYEQNYAKKDAKDFETGEALSKAMGDIRSLVGEQQDAGSSFRRSVAKISDSLAESSGSNETLLSCVPSLIREISEVQKKFEEVSRKLIFSERQIQALQNDLADTRKGMMTDHLTSVGNRRFFDTLVRTTVANSSQLGSDVYLAIIDLDHFKQVNDSLGHDAGDQVLKHFASSMSSLRPDVSLSRIGGDEFAALVRCPTCDDAVEFTEQLRTHFSSNSLILQPNNQKFGTVRFSIGVARLREKDDETSWFHRADSLLYQAKELGRDRAVVEKSVGNGG